MILYELIGLIPPLSLSLSLPPFPLSPSFFLSLCYLSRPRTWQKEGKACQCCVILPLGLLAQCCLSPAQTTPMKLQPRFTLWTSEPLLHKPSMPVDRLQLPEITVLWHEEIHDWSPQKWNTCTRLPPPSFTKEKPVQQSRAVVPADLGESRVFGWRGEMKNKNTGF